MKTETSLKKLIYVAGHRGTKENDLLLSSFAQAQASSLSPEEFALFWAFLQEPDDLIFEWIGGTQPPPVRYIGLCQRITHFTRNP
jgi:succinate dehydrogenase flavin-adding protein (antitoxin of CptAB toxin-antitoxin module)